MNPTDTPSASPSGTATQAPGSAVTHVASLDPSQMVVLVIGLGLLLFALGFIAVRMR